MLLHYVSANGIEPELQSAVPNADEVAALLIAAGAEVDVTCDAYEGRGRTTMDLLVSPEHPTEAGVAGRLLLDRGVNVNANPPGSHWTATPLHTAAIQGQTVVVDLLLRHGADPELKDARHQSTPAGWSQHARRPRRALAREVAALLDG